MKISSRFTVAVHILSLIKIENKPDLTSSYIASSVNTNSVVIRRIMSKLKQANMLETHQGSGGIRLLKSLEDITLLDVYKAVEVVDEGELFQMHEDTNINCIVGNHIQSVLEIILLRAQNAMESVLENVTMDDIVSSILQRDKV